MQGPHGIIPTSKPSTSPLTPHHVYLILILAALAFLCYFYLLLPADMAKKRGRGVIEWGIILLWILGDNPNKIELQTE